MREIMFVQAINEALREEMRRDPAVFIMGEDIRTGVFGATAGLLEEFGPERVRDTPISETGFVGAAIGAAMSGLRPVVENPASFMWVAMDQYVSQAAKNRYMFGGQARIPAVFRCGFFWGGAIAAQHSDRPWATFMTIPGLKVVLPATPADAKGLLKTAIRDDDPVLFFEDFSLMPLKGPVPEEEYTIPLGQADVKRAGTDVTVVALGPMVHRALAAAEQLAGDGISVEVVDPRSLVPMDWPTILGSVAKTGRAVVVDVAHRTCSAASEIAATIAEHGFWNLKAPVRRVTSPDVHIPFSPALEKLVYPDEARIVAAVREVLES